MKAVILNSGLGSRMGDITKTHPKCMTEISENDTILSRQLKLLYKNDIKDVVITTGYFDDILVDYCNKLKLNLNIKFIKNERYSSTNYIYSIYCARNELKDDIILLHGDMVFSNEVIKNILNSQNSCMAISSSVPLPEKDFKAVVSGERIKKIGIDFFENAYTSQPIYYLKRKEWLVWLNKIIEFCEKENVNCYAENAFNEISDNCDIQIYDYKNELCCEIDNVNDLSKVKERIKCYEE